MSQNTGIIAERATWVRYLVLAALCVISTLNYIQRNSIAGVETTLRKQLRIDQTVTGTAMSLFFISYALMQIPSGWLAQRWGPRRALTFFAVAWSIATGMLALARGPTMLYVCRLAMGIFQAGIFPCATLIMVAWLPPARRGLGSALLNSFMLIGGAAVSNGTAFLLEPKGPFGWRELFVLYAAPGFVWAAWFYWWFRDRPQDHRSVNRAELNLIAAGQAPSENAESGRVRVAWMVALCSVPLWLLCIQQFCRAGANRFTDQWLSTYLQEVPLKHLDEADRKKLANNLASVPQYAGVIGGPIGGIISDYVLRRTKSRRAGRNGVAIVSLVVTILCYLPVFASNDGYTQVLFFSLGSFVASFAAPCAYAMSMDVGGKQLPLVFGAMNMVGNFGAATMTGVVPHLIERPKALGLVAGGALATQHPVSPIAPADWQGAVAMFVAVHAVALVCWLLLNPKKTIGEA